MSLARTPGVQPDRPGGHFKRWAQQPWGAPTLPVSVHPKGGGRPRFRTPRGGGRGAPRRRGSRGPHPGPRGTPAPSLPRGVPGGCGQAGERRPGGPCRRVGWEGGRLGGGGIPPPSPDTWKRGVIQGRLRGSVRPRWAVLAHPQCAQWARVTSRTTMGVSRGWRRLLTSSQSSDGVRDCDCCTLPPPNPRP